MLDSVVDLSNAAVIAGALSGLAAVLVLAVTELVRRTGIKAQYIVAAGCALVGILYVTFEAVVPPAAQENVIAFVSRMFLIQWVLYEGVWKRIRDKLSAAGVAGFRDV